MKRNLLLLICLLCSLVLFSQEKMYIHKSDKITLGAFISATDSINFNQDGSKVNFSIGNTIVTYSVSHIDSITFGDNSNIIFITYNGASVSVINPLAFEGVTVVVNGADVIVTSTNENIEITYSLNGLTPDGMFKIYSNNSFKLALNGVNITNPDGPAIDIQSGKKCIVKLEASTTNMLTDGTTYATSTEDKKSTLFSEGALEFTGTGSLNVKSISKHAICSDDYIAIQSGTINVSGAKKDGIHANDYFKMSNGTLNITATSDGIDCEAGYVDISGGSVTTINSTADVKGISCDSTMTISGGIFNITVSGNQSKGLKSSQNMILSGGIFTINTSGAIVLAASGSGYDPSYCTAIKCDSSILISGASITITSSGKAGKGISSDRNIAITSGTLNITTTGAGATYTNATGTLDSYNATCITADGNISITGGSITTSSSGSGGKGISGEGTVVIGNAINSPALNLTTTGAKFVVSGTNYCHPKALKSTGAITINNGTLIISSTDDGVHSDASITQNNGSITINNSVEGIESKFITINGGSMNIAASDDGINATFSTVAGGTEQNDGSCIYINGGIVVSSTTKGDAIDSNGDIVMTGGTVIVHGPPAAPEESIDFNGTFKITGGFLIAAGTNSNMNKAMSTSSTQNGIFASTSTAVAANTLFHVQDASGNNLVTFKPTRNAYSFHFSSASLVNGSYSIYTGGSCTGTVSNGLYSGGSYSGGTLKKSFTVSSKVTSLTF